MTDAPINILLVDDIAENLVALAALLRQPGLTCLRAGSAREALELLLVHEVSLALLDVQMPEIDGFELAELMRGAERTKHIPIIFVTAADHDPQRVFRGYETGAVDFLYKPIDAVVLRSKVDVFVALARQSRQLADALRLSELFVGVLGHDLRNPLGAILSGAELLEHRLTEPRLRTTVQRMLSSARRMGSMIDQLLDVTRVRLGRGAAFEPAREPLDVAEVVQRAVDEVRIAQPARVVAVTVTGDTGLAGDPSRLAQLFSNLIGNAVTHGRAETPITIAVAGRDARVEVAIHNHGAIEPSALATIFEPFQRGPSARGGAGLGLGLYIAREVAVAHGGELTVASTPADGTTFTVTLPVRS